MCALIVGGALLVGCGAATSSTLPTKTYRIGYLSGLASSSTQYANVRQALRERGYTEGQNLVLEARFADGNTDRLPGLAADLVALKPDVIVVLGINVALNLKQATSTIPIVVYATSDPVDGGLVTNLARPGGNITGAVSALGPEVASKRLQLLKDAVPTVARVGYLYDTDANHVRTYERARTTAADLGMELLPLQVRTQDDFAAAFAAALRGHADAIFVGEGALIGSQQSRILEFINANHLPSMGAGSGCVQLGCLMSYAESDLEIWRRAADYVDRILKGADPGSLPMVPSAKLDLIINLKTAKALGITIPPSLIAQATEVIQ
jgi:putative ABC transport system substrate-binding protein